MPRTIQLHHNYPISADELFARVVQYDELSDAMRRIATYEGLPDGAARPGQRFTVKVKLRGWLPTPPWTISVVERDDRKRVLRSEEHGGPVRSWAHTIRVAEAADGCTMHDTVEIDAGLLTGFYVRQAREMYLARHDARRRMLEHELSKAKRL